MRTLSYDVLIIGSGAGGGTIADRLAPYCKKGARIGIVEAGPWYPRESFNMRESDMTCLLREGGAVIPRSFELSIAAGECVGGSTAVYTGVTFRPPPGLIRSWSQAHDLPDLDEDDIHARCPRLEERIDAHYPSRDMENANNRVFREGCEQLGWAAHQFRVNIRDCVECGFCNLGCPYGAKRGTLEVQVPDAMAHGAELVPNCRISRVFEGGAEGLIAEPPEGSRPGPYDAGPVRFEAAKVVLAGGALGSPALLLGSKLPYLSPACGKYLTLHPALMSFGRMPETIDGFHGFPKLYYTDQFSESHDYYIESAFYFPFVTAKSLPGFGRDLRRFMKDYRRVTCALTLVHDEPEERNRIKLKRGRPVVDYRLSRRSKRAIEHAQHSVGRMFFAAGAEEYVSPLIDGFSTSNEDELSRRIDGRSLRGGQAVLNSAHPMGGCRMGSDPETSVTDSWGRVHGHPGIVVADGSLFPTSSKVNPYLTIMALADRIGEGLERELFQAG